MKFLKNHKFCILIFSLCIIVIFLLTMRTINLQSKQKMYIYHEIHYSLSQLNSVITDQKIAGWNEPQVIINQLDKVRTSIFETVKLDQFAGSVLNDDEILLLEEIYEYLKPLPQNELLELGKWNDEDTIYIESVGKALSVSGYEYRDIQLYEWDSMVKQWELLVQNLNDKLN